MPPEQKVAQSIYYAIHALAISLVNSSFIMDKLHKFTATMIDRQHAHLKETCRENNYACRCIVGHKAPSLPSALVPLQKPQCS